LRSGLSPESWGSFDEALPTPQPNCSWGDVDELKLRIFKSSYRSVTRKVCIPKGVWTLAKRESQTLRVDEVGVAGIRTDDMDGPDNVKE
jgi:hypothetical protein